MNNRNWKTTLIGALTILTAVSNSGLEFLKTGQTDFGTALAAIIAGIGLIKAADGN